ncbi:hypothetical protein QT920_016735 [Xanthomonas campestris pv. campestris]|uniref:hypothetical protein n=1 Tax=Xanthomonas campestris TaxID=339 RepID=UPI0025A28CEA|nr:hypothetical protein [Xanthomonas campestris]MDM7693068.1 hypothetical protein [Xanthomonas campestris pv. campestris]MDM7840121.1 hypothetical protein [Xanthomonas campestris pv. campestris]MDM7876424.1 hypothetical protein [Xanthomonas campestris pv. campestris]
MNQDVYIEGLRGRDWRVLWVGGCRQIAGGASPLYVDIVFVHYPFLGRGTPSWRVETRPIEELGLYGVQSLWRNGRIVGYDSSKHPIKTLKIHPRPISSGTPGGRNSPFSEEDYPLYKRSVTADCYTFDSAEGVELIVPCWQILHAWYLFDPQIIPYVIGGMLDANQNYGIETPWLPGTQCDAGHVTYHARPSLAEHQAKRIARLLFDPDANRSARMIHQKLMANRARIPLIWPPHRVPAEWTFRMRRLLPRDGRERWLLLHLQGFDAPSPFSAFELVQEVRAQQEIVDRRPTTARTGAPEVRDVKERPLVGNRTGVRRTTPSSFPALYFLDNSIETMPVTKRSIEKASEPAIGISIVFPNPDVEIEAASMTTLGPEDKAVLAVRPRSPEKEAEESATLFKRSRNAFQAVIDFVAEQPHPEGLPWSARFVESESSDCFFQRYPRMRNFLILELQIGGQYTYLLDVHRKPDDGEFALAMARRVNADALGTEHFHAWLKGFPFSGNDPWGSGVQIPRWLLAPMHVNHQTTQLPASIDKLPEPERELLAEVHYVRHFRNRLIRHIVQYEERLLRKSKRVRKLEHRSKLT